MDNQNVRNKNYSKTDKRYLRSIQQENKEEKDKQLQEQKLSQEERDANPVFYYSEKHKDEETKAQCLKFRKDIKKRIGHKKYSQNVVNQDFEFMNSEDFYLHGFSQSASNKKNEKYKAGEIFIIYDKDITS